MALEMLQKYVHDIYSLCRGVVSISFFEAGLSASSGIPYAGVIAISNASVVRNLIGKSISISWKACNI